MARIRAVECFSVADFFQALLSHNSASQLHVLFLEIAKMKVYDFSPKRKSSSNFVCVDKRFNPSEISKNRHYGWLASASDDGSMVLFNTLQEIKRDIFSLGKRGTKTFRGHRTPVSGVSWNPFDENLIVTCAYDMTCQVCVESFDTIL